MNPFRDGLPAIGGYRGKTGEEMLLFLGIEAATKSIRKGRAVSPSAYNAYRTLIMRAKALEAALDHREEMTGGEGA